MSGWSFSFMPDGGYFLHTPYQTSWSGIPSTVRDKLYNDVEASKRFVTAGPDGGIFYGRHTPRAGDTWTFWQGSGAGEEVTKWLQTTSGAVQLCWGPDRTWMACTSKGAAYWSGALPDNVQSAMRGFHPVKIALGVNHAFVLVAGDGKVKWNLRSKYGGLDEILRNSTSAIEAIALNPYCEGQYFVKFQNGICRAMLPTSYNEAVGKVINDSLQKKGELDMQLAKIYSQGMMEQQKIMNNFYMNMANNMW